MKRGKFSNLRLVQYFLDIDPEKIQKKKTFPPFRRKSIFCFFFDPKMGGKPEGRGRKQEREREEREVEVVLTRVSDKKEIQSKIID